MNTVQPTKPAGAMRYLISKLSVIGLVVCVANVSDAKEIKLGDSAMSYQNQAAWQQIEQFLPQEFHIAKDQLPKEEWWAWNGHNIHLDTYRNPNAKIKVILFHGVGTNGRQMSMILGKPLADRDMKQLQSICRAMV